MDIHEARRLVDGLVRKDGLPADRVGTHTGLTHIRVTISPRLRAVNAKVVTPPTDGNGKVEIRLSEAYVLQSDRQTVRKTVLGEITQLIRANPAWLTLKPAGPSSTVTRLIRWRKAMLAGGVPLRVAHKLVEEIRQEHKRIMASVPRHRRRRAN